MAARGRPWQGRSPRTGAAIGEPACLYPFAAEPVTNAAILERTRRFEALMRRRRTVRDFSPEPVRREVIEAAIRTAATAPSGANQQPWFFVAIADRAAKARIRAAAEAEEKASYAGRA